jgi:shikimate dehydrogenase
MLRLGLLGHPVAHSLSPVLHAHWLRDAGVDGRYEALDLSPEELLPQVLEGADGWNVTLPHKQAVCALVDRLDGDAHAAGAANCLWREDGRWVGGNTDGDGLLAALVGEGIRNPRRLRVWILGAGGAAAGAAAAFVRREADVWLGARRPEAALSLARRVGARGGHGFQEAVLGDGAGIDVLVGALPRGADLPTLVEYLPVKPHTLVVDLNYHDPDPPLLRWARSRGLRSQDGVPMFVEQAALSFERWTGQRPDVVAGRRIIRALIRQRLLDTTPDAGASG